MHGAACMRCISMLLYAQSALGTHMRSAPNASFRSIRKRYALIWFICVDFVLTNNFTFKRKNMVECVVHVVFCICFLIDQCLYTENTNRFLISVMWTLFGCWRLKNIPFFFHYNRKKDPICSHDKLELAKPSSIEKKWRVHFQWHCDSKSID